MFPSSAHQIRRSTNPDTGLGLVSRVLHFARPCCEALRKAELSQNGGADRPRGRRQGNADGGGKESDAVNPPAMGNRPCIGREPVASPAIFASNDRTAALSPREWRRLGSGCHARHGQRLMRGGDQAAPTVSVIIPAYNAAKFLARAVHSALEQSFRVLEIIIVDDGSTDDTIEVAREIGRGDSRVKLIELGQNTGPSNARNTGFASAKGDWIAVLDADDAYLPERLEHLLSIGDGADIVADNLLPYDAAKNIIGKLASERTEGWNGIDLITFADARKDHDDFGLFKPMFRRHFLEEQGLRYREDVRHGEDFLLVFEALALGAVYRLSWRPGYLYTTRNSGWSRTRVDYAGMSKQIEALAGDGGLNLQPAVRAKLVDRAAYLRELEVVHGMKTAIRNKRIFVLLWLVIRYPHVRTLALRKVRRALLKS